MLYYSVIMIIIIVVLQNLLCSLISYQNNATPLYIASQNGHHDVVKTLLGAGADVNIARSDVSHVIFYNYIHEISIFTKRRHDIS